MPSGAEWPSPVSTHGRRAPDRAGLEHPSAGAEAPAVELPAWRASRCHQPISGHRSPAKLRSPLAGPAQVTARQPSSAPMVRRPRHRHDQPRRALGADWASRPAGTPVDGSTLRVGIGGTPQLSTARRPQQRAFVAASDSGVRLLISRHRLPPPSDRRQ